MPELRNVQLHYWSVLITQVVLIVLATFMEDYALLYVFFVIALFGVYGSIIRTIWDKRLFKILALISGIVAVLSGFVWAIPGVSDNCVDTSFVISTLSSAMFILIAIMAIGYNVFITDRVTADRIVGSICMYLLLGMFFSFLYTAADLISPDSMNISWKMGNTLLDFREYLYFSFVTLTTTGYGDILPTRPFTRMLVSFETVTGALYLAIVVARLVGMHITQSHTRRDK